MADSSSALTLEVEPGDALAAPERAAIIALCDRAYGEPIAPYYANLHQPVHVIGRVDGAIVSHALWVTRWLQAGDMPPMRTAYVELVATDPAFQRRGYASAIMRRLAEAIAGFEIGALCPVEGAAAFYERLGWTSWRGLLSIRTANGLIPTPDERIMIYRLPRTPPVDLEAPLSAEWREGELW